MVPRLVEQLVDAGLVTEAQAMASDSSDPLAPSGRIVQNLVAAGLDERVLAAFFVSLGFGPMLQARELARADENLVRRLRAIDAHDICAMPLRPSPAGAIVAMADPTDDRATAKLSEALGGSILPTAAKLSDLLASIERAYPTSHPPLVPDPQALARSQTPSGVVPLVQEKPELGAEQALSALDPSLSELASTASPIWDRAWRRSATVRPPTTSDSTIDADLAELGRVTSRDDVVRVACRACLTAARAAAFLALRKGVFRGWDGGGEDVTSAGIRSLWVPASNPSILNEVLHTGRVFHGAYGQTAADHLFRAALGSQGRTVLIVPVIIGSRLVGVLCANDPASDTSVVERIAEAMGQAFERLIVSKKSGT